MKKQVAKKEPSNQEPRNEVVLRLFSGIPNLTWQLSDADATEVMRRCDQLPTCVVDASYEAPQSGYKGLLVKGVNGQSIKVEAGAEDKAGFVTRGDEGPRLDSGREFEKWLLKTSKGELETSALTFDTLTRSTGLSAIQGIGGQGPVTLTCPTGIAYPDDPGLATWNQSDSGCYNYANDEKAKGVLPATPGNNNTQSWTMAQMRAALIGDKLDSVPGLTVLPNAWPPPGCHYVAVCLRDQVGTRFNDFHCFRLDRDGTWSHKDDASNVRRKDNRRQVITDLRTAVFDTRMTLVGFYISTPGKRKIN